MHLGMSGQMLITHPDVAIAHIARDPFDTQFDQAAAVARIKTKPLGIQRALLDQTLVSGIGNIYADEAPWAAEVHGEMAVSSLTKPRISAVIDGAREIMAAALAQGGTSFDSLYVEVAGSSGYFSRSSERVWACSTSVHALWHSDRAGTVHEPLEPLVPGLPAKTLAERHSTPVH